MAALQLGFCLQTITSDQLRRPSYFQPYIAEFAAPITTSKMKLAINTAFALLALFGSSSASALPVDERSSNATSLEERAPCALHAIWESNWSSGAYRRYRVRGRAEGTFNGVNNYEMVRQWCRFFHGMSQASLSIDIPTARKRANGASTQPTQATSLTATSLSFRTLNAAPGMAKTGPGPT